MPRNPSGVYSLPAGSIVALGEDILPSQHNTPLQDIAADLNTRAAIDSPALTGTPTAPTPAPGDNSTNIATTAFVAGAAAAIVPPGSVIWYVANAAPAGYLKANGALVSRTTYAALFAAIGTTYGVGDGSTTFALPDLRGEFIRGWDDGRGVDAGRVFGSAQADELKSHTHTGVVGDTAFGDFARTGAQDAPAGNAVIGSTGGAETRPRNIALLACIKF